MEVARNIIYMIDAGFVIVLTSIFRYTSFYNDILNRL
jgi:hypothetical protein